MMIYSSIDKSVLKITCPKDFISSTNRVSICKIKKSFKKRCFSNGLVGLFEMHFHIAYTGETPSADASPARQSEMGVSKSRVLTTMISK